MANYTLRPDGLVTGRGIILIRRFRHIARHYDNDNLQYKEEIADFFQRTQAIIPNIRGRLRSMIAAYRRYVAMLCNLDASGYDTSDYLDEREYAAKILFGEEAWI